VDKGAPERKTAAVTRTYGRAAFFRGKRARRYDAGMRRFLVVVLLLAGCAAAAPAAPATENASSSAPSSRPLPQVTPELSIDSLAGMRLEGTGLTLARVLDDNDAYVRYEIRYRSNGLAISGIMNVPKGPGPFPLVVLNHGYIDPKVYTIGRGLKREQDYLARRGFAVLHTDYRKHGASDPSPDVRDAYDAGLEYAMDSINAITAVRAHPPAGVDASKVGMLGHSMGGGVTLNVLTAYPDLVDAAVLYAPVNADAWENYDRWGRDTDVVDRTVETLGTRATNPAAWDALSSRTYLGRVAAPILLFQGTADKEVPVAWSDALDVDLATLEKPHEYVRYDGEGHEFGPRWNDFMAKTAAFFDRELR
jgi:dipeptidyl aminopeptidase/acylaminoacyl peptidase